MKNSRKNSGFSLIELLVVIAIIGLLSSFILVSVAYARNKAKDARLKASIHQFRVLAEANSVETGLYDAVPTPDASAGYKLAQDIVAQGGVLEQGASDDFSSYCASTKLNGGGNFCQDTKGNTIDGVCSVGVCASASPTPTPTSPPSNPPTNTPTASPTPTPTLGPTITPTANPTPTPTLGPTITPTATPTTSFSPFPTSTP